MPAEKKNKGGRPSKFEGLDMEAIKKMATEGKTDEEIAKAFKITVRTFHNYKEKHPEFFHSLKDWKAEADDRVERSLYERATGYSHAETKLFLYEGSVIAETVTKHYPPDTTAAIFWLKNRKPEQWREKQPEELDTVTKIEIVRRKKPIDNGNDTD